MLKRPRRHAALAQFAAVTTAGQWPSFQALEDSVNLSHIIAAAVTQPERRSQRKSEGKRMKEEIEYEGRAFQLIREVPIH